MKPFHLLSFAICCGSLEYYDKAYDRVNVKNEKPLQRIDRIFHTVTTTDDPIIRKLSKTEGTVFATDAILATLMCCTRSNYSWDIVIEKIGDKLFFDKRDNTEFDLLTVNETSVEPPQDDGNSLNSPRNLALEATFINHNFSQQVLKTGEPRFKFDDPNPFISEEEADEVASVAYRYRKWDLDNGVLLIARCEHDAVMHGPNGELQFITIKALNEWDSKLSGGVEWRQKLDTQRGAVLANELRNNACKLAKWTVQAILAGSDQIKFGYVSRAHVRDSSKHVILGTQQYKPNEFATQITLNMDNAWGILRCIVDICMKQKDGKYLIMKDPNKSMIRLYDIPDNTFESENEDADEDDGATFAMFTLTIIHFKRQQSKTNKDSSVADCLGTGKDVTNVLIDGVSPSQHSAQQMLDAEFLTARVFTTSWSLDLGWGGVTLCVLASVLWILLSKIMRYSPLSTLLA